MSAPNWNNQTIWTGDCIDVMHGMNSASVDLIYLDPPFFSRRAFIAAEGKATKTDVFQNTDDYEKSLPWRDAIRTEHSDLVAVIDAAEKIHGKEMAGYLCFLAERIIEMHRLLKRTGSVYLHTDPTMSHYPKLIMDAIFGPKNLRNEICWALGKGPRTVRKSWARRHEVLLFYSKSDDWFFQSPGTEDQERSARYRTHAGRVFDRDYQAEKPGLMQKEEDGSLWIDVATLRPLMGPKEPTGHPTQKPLALLERIIGASSKIGDMVLDPFCGCATACVAAERAGRQWAGIDVSPSAVEILKSRLEAEGESFIGEHLTEPPERTDL